MANVLLVEDNQELARNVREWLEFNKYRVEWAADGADALQLLDASVFDLIILDWEIPTVQGVDVCRKFRTRGGSTPVLMLTGKDKVDEKVQALDAGADDYLTKPFHMNELAARLRALLRRGPVAADHKLKKGNIELDRDRHEVRCSGELIKLYPREYELLEFFMNNPNTVFSANDLLQSVWTLDADASETAVRTCIKTLRRKVTPEGAESPIETVHGVGYKFRDP
jgi:DNA-binding response OmpR family regulator